MGIPKLIKKRLNSIKSIEKITKALEMVSTSKIQKAKRKALDCQPFQEKTYQLVQKLALHPNLPSLPLLLPHQSLESGLYVLITSNKGLTGSLNSNLLRFLTNFLKDTPSAKHTFITLGKKGRDFALKNGELMADFSESFPSMSILPALIKMLVDNFVSGKSDEVFLIYNDFVSVFSQQPKSQKLLPITSQEFFGAEEVRHDDYTFEPSAREVLNKILPFYLEVQVAQAINHAVASEHAARMMAMREASNDALELCQNLSLEFNKARQQAITSEINDIVAAKIS